MKESLCAHWSAAIILQRWSTEESSVKIHTMKLYRSIAYFLILLSFTTILAQEAVCGAVVQKALDAVGQSCAAMGRNQACYGYVSLQATPRDGVQNFNFTQDGDLVNVADIASLQLSQLDVTNNTWGIAMMKLQANLPDSLPGQNVAFLVFGDVQIQNASAPGAGQPTAQVSTSAKVNVRSTPSTDGAIVGSFSAGQTTTANGRNADGSWLRIQLPESDALGWVFASLVKVSGDASSLTVVDSTQAQTSYTPMQAFYFKTGITQTNCEQAPQDGILIQTPKGAGQVNLRANDVDIQLGSTAFFQAQPNGNMTVSVVEGEGHITAQGVTVAVPAGTQTTIPLDANLHASGAPTPAQPYDAALVAPLPIRVLPDPITVALPAVATAEATSAAAAPAVTATPSAGGAASGQVYTAQTIMDFGGATVSGSVCAIDTPFSLTLASPSFSFVVQFVPSDAAKGTYSYNFTIADGETGVSSGTYTITDPAADGSRTLTIDGKEVHTFLGDSNTIPIHYSIGLTPTSTCGG